MSHSELLQNSVPNDIALKIASSLQVSDLCSLGSCSRFWRELCGSDCLWAALYSDRWPSALVLDDKETETSSPEGWRRLYINKHKEMAAKAAFIVKFVEQCLSSESMEAGHYLAMIEELCSMQFGFIDVQMFFLKPELHVLLNLIGLHYCISWLGIPAECVTKVLWHYKIAERQVRVQWWKMGRWLYGFRLRDEAHDRNVSLEDLTMMEEEEVLRVLQRGAVYEVLRVRISAAKPNCTSWACQNAETWN